LYLPLVKAVEVSQIIPFIYQTYFVMSKKKSTLKDLRISSFATQLEKSDLDQVKGGAAYIRGAKLTFRVRWTTVDTRAEVTESIVTQGGR
jgi:hypothetical protein